MVAKNYVSYVVPSYINTTLLDNITLKFRVKKPLKNVNIVISDDKRIIKRIPKLTLLPSQMENIVIKTLDLVQNNGKIYVDIEMKI